jgi:hypothetical protein
MKGYVLTVERTIAASPEAIFGVLSQVGRHSSIDGSGMLQGAASEIDEPLTLGSTFRMDMKMVGLRYQTESRVVEFEADRRIAWKTGPSGTLGRYVAGRVWRYDLEPVDGGTLVRESWDITADHQRVLLKLGGIYSGKTERDMERTLARLDSVVTGTGVKES